MANPQLQAVNIEYDEGVKLQAVNLQYDEGVKLLAINIQYDDLATRLLAGTYKQLIINS